MTRPSRLAAGALLLSSLSLASSLPGPPGPPPPPPSLVVPLEWTLEALDLSVAQRSAVAQLMEAHHALQDARHDPLRAAREALREAVLADPLDEQAIRRAAGEVAGLDAERAVADASLLRDVRAILTPAQRAEVTDALARLPPPGVPRR